MSEGLVTTTRGSGPLIATAVHDGHAVRPEVAALLALDDAGRLREEDPFTGEWTAVAPTRLVVTRSRFEVDLNRPRERAVYQVPGDAWGLQVWHAPPPPDLVSRSLDLYDAFYATARDVLSEVGRREGRFVVFDLHSYNHRRDGPESPPADQASHPAVNLGTGTMHREQWAPVVDRFLDELRAAPFPGGHLDVRENVKFRGGHFSRWVHETFPRSGCALAIEFKKFFMDEWTGEPDRPALHAIGQALSATVPGVLEALARL